MDKEVIGNSCTRFLNMMKKQKFRESPYAYFLLINMHHLFFDDKTKEYMKSPMTIKQISSLICNKKTFLRPDVIYTIRYLIDSKVIQKHNQKLSFLDDKDKYLIDLKSLRREIDSWKITQKVVYTYLDDCGLRDIELDN